MNNKNRLIIITLLLAALGSVAFAVFYFSNDEENNNAFSKKSSRNYTSNNDSIERLDQLNVDSTNPYVVKNLKSKSTIQGVVQGGEGLQIFLEQPSEQNKGSVIAQCVIDQDGNFKLSPKIPDLDVYALTLKNTQNKLLKTIPLTLIPGDSLGILTTIQNFDSKPIISGVDYNDALNKLLLIYNIKSQVSDKEKFNKMNSFVQEFMKKNPKSSFNILLVNYFFMPTSDNIAYFETVVNKFSKEYPNSKHSLNFQRMLNSIRPEFEIQKIDGTEFKISTLKGKIVLVDFWASWCGPCRKSNPEIVKLYQKFKNKGFEIVSISLDTDENQWKNAIESDKLDWPNHLSELKGWQSSFVQQFGITQIPNTLVLDRSGIVIARGLLGQNLEEFISKAIYEN